MSISKAQKLIENMLALVGVKVDGGSPWDMQVHNPKLFQRILTKGSLGLGEAYVEGWWDCEDLESFFYKVLRTDLESRLRQQTGALATILYYRSREWLASIVNFQSQHRAFAVGERHYDLNKLLFQNMLDSEMNYTCGYWRSANNLEDAQYAKLALTCGKLYLRPGMRILDIGCGWGAFAKYVAQNYGASVVGVTVSKEQQEYAMENCRGLPVEIRLQDYREVTGTFDRVVSLGMFEHVGVKNYRNYFQVARRCLRDQGLLLLHTIGGNRSLKVADPWISKYIFPNGLIPSVAQVGEASEGLFIMEDWHNFGVDYNKTLLAWHKNFMEHWAQISNHFDERFFRIWRYYLLSCAGAFKARNLQLWQIVFSKGGVNGGYKPIR